MTLAVGVFMAACSNVPVWTALTRGDFVNPQLTPIWLTLLLLIRLAVPSLSVCRAASELIFGSAIGSSVGLGVAAIARAARRRDPPDAVRAAILTSMALPILFLLGLIRYRSLATAVFGLFLSLFFGLAVAGSYRSDVIWTYPAYLILYVCLAAASALVACYVLAPLPSTLRCFRSVGASLDSSATIVTAVAEAMTGPYDPETGHLASVKGELHPTMLRVDAGLREFVLSIVHEAFAGSQSIVAAQTFSDAARGELDLYSPAPVHPLRETFVVTMLCRDVLATAFSSVELVQDGRISVRKIASPGPRLRIRRAAEGIARALRGAGQAIAKNEPVAEGVEGLKHAVRELVDLVAAAVGDEMEERDEERAERISTQPDGGEAASAGSGAGEVSRADGERAGQRGVGGGGVRADGGGRGEGAGATQADGGGGENEESRAGATGPDRGDTAAARHADAILAARPRCPSDPGALRRSDGGGSPGHPEARGRTETTGPVERSTVAPRKRAQGAPLTSADHLAFRQAVTSLCTTVSRVIDLYRVVPALIEPWQPSAREVIEQGLRGLPELRLGLAVAQRKADNKEGFGGGAGAEAADDTAPGRPGDTPSAENGGQTNAGRGRSLHAGAGGPELERRPLRSAETAAEQAGARARPPSRALGGGLRAPGLWEPNMRRRDDRKLPDLLGLADRVRGGQNDANARDSGSSAGSGRRGAVGVASDEEGRVSDDRGGPCVPSAASTLPRSGSERDRSAATPAPWLSSASLEPRLTVPTMSPATPPRPAQLGSDVTSASLLVHGVGATPLRQRGAAEAARSAAPEASPAPGSVRSAAPEASFPPDSGCSGSLEPSSWAPALGRREVVLLGALVAPIEVRKAPLPRTPEGKARRQGDDREDAFGAFALAPDSKASSAPLKSDLSTLEQSVVARSAPLHAPRSSAPAPLASTSLLRSAASGARFAARSIYRFPSTVLAPVCWALAPFGVRPGHVRLAVQLCVTYSVCLVLVFSGTANERLDHGRAAIWTAMSALGIADSSSGAATRKALFRTVGTLAGGAVALGILYASNLINGLEFAPKPGRMISTSILLSATLGVNAAFASRSPPSSYVNIAFGIIVGAASLAGYVTGDTWRYALYRIAFTLVGVCLHSIVSVLVLPVTARDRYRAGVAGVLRATGKGYEHLLLAIIPPRERETEGYVADDDGVATKPACEPTSGREGAAGEAPARSTKRGTAARGGEKCGGVQGHARGLAELTCKAPGASVRSPPPPLPRPPPTALTTPASIYTPRATFFSLLKAFVWQSGLPLRVDALLLDDPWPIGPRFLEMYADFNPPSVALAGQRSFLALFPYEWSLYERPHRIKDASAAVRLQLVLRRILNTMVTQATALDALGIRHLEPLSRLEGPLRDVAAQLRACLDAQALALDRAIPPSDAFALLEDLDAHTRRFFLMAALSVPLGEAGGRDVRHTALLGLAGSLATVSAAARQSARCIAATFWGEDSVVWAEAEAKLGSPASWTVNEELELAARNALGNEFAARVRNGDISFVGSMWESPTRSVHTIDV